jgi:hypothetical protein
MSAVGPEPEQADENDEDDANGQGWQPTEDQVDHDEHAGDHGEPEEHVRSMQEGVMRHALVGIVIAANLAISIGASAVEPTRLDFEFDRVVLAPATSRACGFAVYHHDVGTGRIVLFGDADGTVVRELDQELSTSTWFSPETGRSFTFPYPARLHTFYEGNDMGDAASPR